MGFKLRDRLLASWWRPVSVWIILYDMLYNVLQRLFLASRCNESAFGGSVLEKHLQKSEWKPIQMNGAISCYWYPRLGQIICEHHVLEYPLLVVVSQSLSLTIYYSLRARDLIRLHLGYRSYRGWINVRTTPHSYLGSSQSCISEFSVGLSYSRQSHIKDILYQLLIVRSPP